jgi:hypothetical protein
MIIHALLGSVLFYYGRRVRVAAMYPQGGKWPLLAVLRSIPRWDQERVIYTIGGATLQFAGVIILISLIPFI